MRPPAIPVPQATIASLLESVQMLKQAVELLNGAVGDRTQRAVTFVDLINLGTIKPEEVPEKLGPLPRRV
jgi:hypothetical protein